MPRRSLRLAGSLRGSNGPLNTKPGCGAAMSPAFKAYIKKAPRLGRFLVYYKTYFLQSVISPLTAAAATMRGLMRIVLPVGLPWRPLKLRFDVEAQLSLIHI